MTRQAATLQRLGLSKWDPRVVERRVNVEILCPFFTNKVIASYLNTSASSITKDIRSMGFHKYGNTKYFGRSWKRRARSRAKVQMGEVSDHDTYLDRCEADERRIHELK